MSSPTTNRKSDSDLLEKIRNGDSNAFRILFFRYHQKLVDFSYYRTKNLEVSKDLVQEIFTKTWISRENLDPKKSIKSYLYKSLTNQIINFFNSSSAKTLKFDDSILRSSSNHNDDLENKIDIFTAIEKLPEQLKTVFMLSRIEGFKYSEIAEICSISVKAVEKRMTKCLKILRKLMVH